MISCLKMFNTHHDELNERSIKCFELYLSMKHNNESLHIITFL